MELTGSDIGVIDVIEAWRQHLGTTVQDQSICKLWAPTWTTDTKGWGFVADTMSTSNLHP